MAESAVHIFGVRHHGPGSARSLVRALERLAPDLILVEGPPEADDLVAFAAREELAPPVALLIYDPEKPADAATYPFAVFSPEWQALQYGVKTGVSVRFMDLPQGIQMALATERAEAAAAAGDAGLEFPGLPQRDPLGWLAQAAGEPDGEQWWERMFEHRRDGADAFAAVLAAMGELRAAGVDWTRTADETRLAALREAHMRQTIRAAERAGRARIAVVCGAWHAPALATRPPAREDAALLKGLPKTKVAATWIPWTYGRLAFASGYGAGIHSPGWYEFLWQGRALAADRLATRWLAKVARLLRAEDYDASAGGVIEAVRLAESLAALRGRGLPGLPELNEATRGVLCGGDELPLGLIAERLIVAERLGTVPDDTPAVPLARDLAREQKRLRLKPELLPRDLDLDLRTENDLDRSRLLHRLRLLGIDWGERRPQPGAQKGTFHEFWQLAWEPEFAVAVIQAGVWGATLPLAATAKIRHAAAHADNLPALTALVDGTLLADLPAAAEVLLARLASVAAVAADVGLLMDALAPLANLLRYGNVRQSDATVVAGVVTGLVTRIVIGLPGACASLDDAAAGELFDRLLTTHAAVQLLQNPDHSEAWLAVLRQLADQAGLHGLVAGRACRLLLEARRVTPAEAAQRLAFALSVAHAPAQSAAWVEGWLRAGGLVLVHDDALWRVLDDWVTALPPDHFTTVLPLLRRTFETFAVGERRQLATRVAAAEGGRGVGAGRSAAPDEFDVARGDLALPLLAQILGLKLESTP